MGAKENLEYIKNELSNEEKLLESVIKAEKFYKKYRKPLKLFAIAFVVVGLGYGAYEWKKELDLQASNEAYMKLLQNPKNSEALKTLQEKNPKLYWLYLYKEALATKDVQKLQEIAKRDIAVLSDLAAYHLAVLQRDEPKLYSYGIKDRAILKELAILDDVYLNMEQGKIAVAKERLKSISQESVAAPFAKLLGHYGVKVK